LYATRVARNESTFRNVNEGIEAGRRLTDEATPSRYVCECARLGCTELIALLPSEYEAIRSHRRRFAVVPGHEVPDVEQVVERQPAFFVVEKVGVAGEAAGNADPRAGG